MGRWAGLSGLIDFECGSSPNSNSRPHRYGLSGLTLTTRYSKLDDSIFVLCRNCGHSLKTEELTKMAAYATATTAAANAAATTPTTARTFYTSPKQFFTWSASAANHRLQKMSKNIVNNVCKLQTKMEKALPSSFNLTTSPSPVPSESSLSDGGFATIRRQSCGTLISNNNNNNSDFEPSSDFKRLRRNIKDTNLNSFKSYGTENEFTSNSFVYHNNSFESDSNQCDNSFEFSAGDLTDLDKDNLVKSLDFTVGSILDMRPETQHVFYDSKLSAASEGGSSRNTTSSSSISTAVTVPVTSPHWSRASSVSVESSSHCDNQGGSNVLNNLRSNNASCNIESDPLSSLICHPNGSTILSSPPSLLKTPLCSTLPSSISSSSTSSSSSPPSSSSSSSLTTTSGSSIVTDALKNVATITSKSGTIATNTSATLPNSKLTVTIFEEEAELKHAAWFQAGIPREIALEVLRNEPIGSFIVRESTTKVGCFALSVRVPREFQPTGIAHYLILKTGRGYKIKGFTKEFGSLTSLITHHSVMPELLPCPLSLHRYRPSHPVRVSRQHSTDFVEPEKLISFRKFTDF